MTTEQQNQNTTKKPDNRILRGVGYLVGAAVMIAWFISVRNQSINDKAKYIVKDKGAQKISYAPIESQNDTHIMEFGAFSADSMLYDNINVGDTILGRKSALDDTVSQASYIAMSEFFRHSNIYYINSKSLTQLEEMYRKNTR